MRKIELTKKQELYLVKKYSSNELSIKQLAEKFGVSKNTISRRIKKYIKLKPVSSTNRKYSVNHNIFNIIDTEEKAYWLGILYADGSINDKRNTVILSLIDKSHIEKFKKFLSANYKIYTEVHKKYNKKIYKLTVVSKQIVNDLKKLGCIPRKALVIKYPNTSLVPKHLNNHFIRGYFDGDGTVTVFKYRKDIEGILSMRLTSGFSSGSKKFITTLQNQLHKQKVITKRKNCYVFYYSIQDSLYLYKYMYNNSTIWLDRKKQKFESYFKERASQTTIGHPRLRVKV